jgi:ADP-ribose pyrophosphatase
VNWKTLSSKQVLSFGKWLSVDDRTVATPGGQQIEHWPWVTTPDYINVVAETTGGRFLIFRQGKYGLDGESLAPVGGYIEPGEEPLAAAKRELREETGHEAPEWVSLGAFLVDPNRGMATGNLFLARGAVRVTDSYADDLEEQHLLMLDRAELEAALRAGQFKVLAWAANVALALMRL